MLLNSSQAKWVYTLQERLRHRGVILDLFAIVEVPECKSKSGTKLPTNWKTSNQPIVCTLEDWEFTPEHSQQLTVVCKVEDSFAGVIFLNDTSFTLTYLKPHSYTEPVLSPYDKLHLNSKDVPNYSKSKTDEQTTIGRYFLNYLNFIHPFGSKIEYVNKEISPKMVDALVAQLYVEHPELVDSEDQVSAHDTFMGNFYFPGGFGDIFVPVFSKKSLQTSPEVKSRLKELLEEHKDELHDPVIASAIEDELIGMDREYIKDDPSYGFYGSDNKKFNVHRKKQYIVGGIVESFGESVKEFDFVKTPLDEGWKVEEFQLLVNDIRSGSYKRGIETALGGEQTKYLIRIFQNTKITEDDCKTTSGLKFTLTEHLALKFLDRYIIENGKLVLLAPHNIRSYIGKQINLRSIMYCKTNPGICSKCAGRIFEQLGSEAVGVFIVDIGTSFLISSMKSMHGTKTSSFTINDLSEYMVDVVPMVP